MEENVILKKIFLKKYENIDKKNNTKCSGKKRKFLAGLLLAAKLLLGKRESSSTELLN